MSVQYPSAIFSPTAKVNGSIVTAPDWNDALGESVAVETELGTNPRINAISEDHGSVKNRFNDIDLRTIQNLLTNGGMEIWQRNTSFSTPASGAYTADRWRANYDGAPTFVISREATIVDSGLYAMKLDVTVVGGATICRMINEQENNLIYAVRGKTISVYARVRTNVAGKVRMQVADGVVTATSSAYHSGGGTYETLIHTKTMNAASSAFQILIGMDPAAGVAVSTTYIDSVMVVIGTKAIVFVAPDPQVELARCQRYYEKSYNQSVFAGANPTDFGADSWRLVAAIPAGEVFRSFQYQVGKRTAPTITLYSTQTGTANRVRNATTGVDHTALAANVADHAFEIFDSASAGPGAANNLIRMHWTADAEI